MYLFTQLLTIKKHPLKPLKQETVKNHYTVKAF